MCAVGGVRRRSESRWGESAITALAGFNTEVRKVKKRRVIILVAAVLFAPMSLVRHDLLLQQEGYSVHCLHFSHFLKRFISTAPGDGGADYISGVFWSSYGSRMLGLDFESEIPVRSSNVANYVLDKDYYYFNCGKLYFENGDGYMRPLPAPMAWSRFNKSQCEVYKVSIMVAESRIG